MNCEIIRDLLPLYADKCCSDEACKEVEKHLSECFECAEIYEKMSCTLLEGLVNTAPKKMKKISYWKASVLQSVLFFLSFAIITAGVALEAGSPLGFTNGFWAFTLVIPATGFMLSLANWYFIRLYKNSKAFSTWSVVATVGITLCSFVWACFHYELNLFVFFGNLNTGNMLLMLGGLMYFFLPGIIVVAVLCVVSEIASKKYASLIGKD